MNVLVSSTLSVDSQPLLELVEVAGTEFLSPPTGKEDTAVFPKEPEDSFAGL